MSTRGWCSLRLRFDQRELTLLRASEQVRGAALAQSPRPEQLRTALNLAKAGHKLGHAEAGASVSLDEPELGLLLEALHYAMNEVQWLARTPDGAAEPRRRAVLSAFPELVDQGWRSFGLTRELETVAARLHAALTA